MSVRVFPSVSPDDCSCSFSMCVEPAAIDRVGRLLTTFGELRHSELRWSDTAGELIAES